jgi:hypothetical protein
MEALAVNKIFAFMRGTHAMHPKFGVLKIERLLAPIFLLAAALSLPASAQVPGWSAYENPIWGYRVHYPAQLFTVVAEAPGHGGVTISTDDGQARLSLFGGPHLPGRSTLELADDLSIVPEIYEVTYRRVTQNWIVLSGYLSDGTGAASDIIFYQRIAVSPDGERIAGFSLEYPVALRGNVDHLIGTIGRSLRIY